MNINFNTSLQKYLPYIIAVLIAYVLTVIIFFFLPKHGVDYIETTDIGINYKKYDTFYSKIRPISSKPIVQNRVEKRKIETLSKYILKAIYSTELNNGWIIIEEKSSKKTIILEKNQKLKDYTLNKLFKNHVIFEKNSREYKLELPKEKDLSYEIKKKTASGTNEDIIVNADSVTVKRNYLNNYVNDLDKVWKDIAIKDVRNDGKIEGFKIFNVNENSVFGKLGLKKGDIIKSVNGKEIKSYGDAFKIYNEINKLDYLTFEVLRNNEIMELRYEID